MTIDLDAAAALFLIPPDGRGKEVASGSLREMVTLAMAWPEREFSQARIYTGLNTFGVTEIERLAAEAGIPKRAKRPFQR